MMNNGESDLVQEGDETELASEPSRGQLDALRQALTGSGEATAEAHPAEALLAPARVDETTPSRGPVVTFPPRFFAAPITGIERTQATQFFSINGKGSGNAAANSVPLVANKDLILRVYVRKDSVWWPHVPTTVTGKLSYPGHPDLPPLNGPISALQRSVLDRNNANHTLNFRVPGAHCVGTVNFKVNVWDPAQPGDASASMLSTTVSLTFQAVPRVRVHGVLIHYTGKGLDIPAPTGLDLVNTLAWVGKTYPVSGFNYTACDVVKFSGDLTVGGGGGCGTGWNQLFSLLWNMRAASGTNDVFVGLLPPGVPTSGVIGCGGGVAIAYKGGGSVLAQEIGHAFGRDHAPCGNPGGPDPNYPAYGSYPSGSIGEFGFDGATSQIFDPGSTFDFMSYCGPVWTSPYTYTGLRNAIVASPAAAHPDAAGGRNAEREHLYLNYRMLSSGEVDLLPSFHLAGGAPGAETGPESSVSCDLMGPGGRVLETHRCAITNPHMDPEGPVIEFHEAVPWSDEVESLVFRRGGEVCHTLKVEASAPELRAPVVAHTDRGPSIVRLEWGAKAHAAAHSAVRYVVRYSHDGGKTWRAVAADLTDSRLTVDLDLLPGGRHCLFQVVASAGLRTSTATAEPIEVPRKARQAHILAPEDGATFAAGEDVEFLGGGFSPDFETVEGEDVTWTSNRDGNIGTGYQLVTRRLSRGRHQITASLPDGMRGEARVNVGVTVH